MLQPGTPKPGARLSSTCSPLWVSHRPSAYPWACPIILNEFARNQGKCFLDFFLLCSFFTFGKVKL